MFLCFAAQDSQPKGVMVLSSMGNADNSSAKAWVVIAVLSGMCVGVVAAWISWSGNGDVQQCVVTGGGAFAATFGLVLGGRTFVNQGPPQSGHTHTCERQ